MADKVFMNSAEETAYDRNLRSNDETRGQVLPFKKTDAGLEWALPQWMEDIYNSITLPRDTLQGYQPTVKDAVDFAGNVGTGGMGASAVTHPAADVGMFLGVRAKGAPIRQLDKAELMSEAGRSAEDIWRTTGWFQAPDGNWKWEMSDNKMDFTPQAKPLIEDTLNPQAPGSVEGNTKDFVAHDDLYNQYFSKGEANPQDYTSKIDYKPNPSGSHTPGLYIDASGPTKEDLLDTLSHELQHSVQAKEDFPRGSSNSHVLSVKAELKDALPDEAKRLMELRDNVDRLEHEIKIKQSESNAPSGWGSIGDNDPSQQASSSSIVDMNDQLVKNLKEAADLANKLRPILPELSQVFKVLDTNDYELYRRNMGEVEANATLARRNLNDYERSVRYPWLDYDRSKEDQWSPETLTMLRDNLHNAMREKWNNKINDPGTGLQDAEIISGD